MLGGEAVRCVYVCGVGRWFMGMWLGVTCYFNVNIRILQGDIKSSHSHHLFRRTYYHTARDAVWTNDVA